MWLEFLRLLLGLKKGGRLKKREIRFVVPENIYNRIKAFADEYGEPVGPCCRRLTLDRLTALEAIEAQKSIPAMTEMISRMLSCDPEQMDPSTIKALKAVIDASE